MLTQEDIFSLIPRVETLLTTTLKELAEVSEKIANFKDYASDDYVSTFKRNKALENRLEGLNKAKKLLQSYKEAKDILSGGITDNELISLAQDELNHLPFEIQAVYDSHISENSKFQNVVMEIRAGAGGEEAALFAQEVFRMYSQFGAERGWKVELTDSEVSEKGGFRHIDVYIEGQDAFFWLQNEMGVHRVQRVPATESSGRIHTSTISVAILPEVGDVEVKIDPRDIEMEAFRSSGPGGQSVNKTSSAVRLKHIPTGIIVSSQVERSQLKNKEAALRIIKSKIYVAQQEAMSKEMGDLRRSQIGTGDRSEKIRTYNFPQSRVTDHRVKKSWFNINEIMDGKLETVLSDVRRLLLEGVTGDDSDDDE